MKSIVVRLELEYWFRSTIDHLIIFKFSLIIFNLLVLSNYTRECWDHKHVVLVSCVVKSRVASTIITLWSIVSPEFDSFVVLSHHISGSDRKIWRLGLRSCCKVDAYRSSLLPHTPTPPQYHLVSSETYPSVVTVLWTRSLMLFVVFWHNSK